MNGMEVLRERIARALWEFPLNDCHCPVAGPCGRCKSDSEEMADAVIAALGLVEKPGTRLGCADGTAAIVNGIYVSGVFGGCPEFQTTGTCPHCAGGRHWETPWERLDGATSEAITKALHDAGGEWWREDSDGPLPGSGRDGTVSGLEGKEPGREGKVPGLEGVGTGRAAVGTQPERSRKRRRGKRGGSGR